MRDKGAEIIADARKEGRHIIVLAGRPYHVDPEINHGINKLIIRLGAAVVYRGFRQLLAWQKFPTTVLQPVDLPRPPVRRRQVHCQHQPDMDLVQLVSFGCGVDAITTDEAREILQAGGQDCTPRSKLTKSPTWAR